MQKNKIFTINFIIHKKITIWLEFLHIYIINNKYTIEIIILVIHNIVVSYNIYCKYFIINLKIVKWKKLPLYISIIVLIYNKCQRNNV